MTVETELPAVLGKLPASGGPDVVWVGAVKTKVVVTVVPASGDVGPVDPGLVPAVRMSG